MQYNAQDFVEEWIGEVCRHVMSTTFNYKINKDMTIIHAKCTAANQLYNMFVCSHRTMRSVPAFSVSWINHEEGNALLGQKYP